MKTLLILTLFLSQYSYGQNCADELLFHHFRKDIQFELLNYKQIEWDNETRESYYTLMQCCPIDSLAKYVDDSIPAIRCLIFLGLAQKNANTDFLTQILLKHTNDIAEYKDSPHDVSITWNVRDFMQTILNLKSAKQIPNEAGDYKTRLETLRNKLSILIPGKYHGVVSKKSLLRVDSLMCSIKGYKIISFTLIKANRTVTTKNIFTKEINEFISNMKTGETLVIDEIMVEDLNKAVRRIPSQALKLN